MQSMFNHNTHLLFCYEPTYYCTKQSLYMDDNSATGAEQARPMPVFGQLAGEKQKYRGVEEVHVVLFCWRYLLDLSSVTTSYLSPLSRQSTWHLELSIRHLIIPLLPSMYGC